MAFKRFNPSWIGLYRSTNSSYVGANQISVGGSSKHYTYSGFNVVSILEAINTSKVVAKVHLRLQVTNAGPFSLGMHKDSTNKASQGMPYFNFTQKSYAANLGLQSFDVTKFPNLSGYKTFKSAIQSGGFKGFTLYGGSYGDLLTASSMYVEVEGVWNEPPTAGNITYPVGGEILNGYLTMKATAGSDPENDSLTYQFALKDTDGFHYFNRQNALSLTVDLSKYKETTDAQVAVRAYDGQLYSPWKYSKAFAIRHNTPPSKPTLKYPVGGVSINRRDSILFSWQHNDSGVQSAYSFRYRLKGSSTWISSRTVSTNQYRAVKDETVPLGEIEWQVQTEDNYGLVSPWSNTGIYVSAIESNAPTILSPEDEAILSSSELTLVWSTSQQEEYEIEVREGGNVVWSTTKESANKAVTLGYSFNNNSSYIVYVRTRVRNGLWSQWVYVDVSTSFQPPNQADVSISADNERGAILLSITNPLPSGDTPDADYNSIERRDADSGWVVVADNVPVNGTFEDDSPASGKVYEYKVNVHGNNGVIMQGIPTLGSVNFEHVILSIARDKSTHMVLSKVFSRNQNEVFNAVEKRFNGRSKRTVEFNDTTDNDLSINVKLTKEELTYLRNMLARKETLLYRDRRGRRMFVISNNLSISDVMIDKYEVSIPFIEVSYIEKGVALDD